MSSTSSHLIAFNKPFDVLCQFTDRPVERAAPDTPLRARRGAGGDAGAASKPRRRATLADFIDIKGFYPAGRLDRDSEGLVLLTDDGRLQQRIADPRFKQWKTYEVQVEGIPDADALGRLARGVELNDGPTLPARAEAIAEPAGLWPRDPPIRHRANIPTSWLRLAIREGRNRQVRRMTAAVGHPTLRLIRVAIGDITLGDLAPGEWRFETPDQL